MAIQNRISFNDFSILMAGRTKQEYLIEKTEDVLLNDEIGSGEKLFYLILVLHGERDRDHFLGEYNLSPSSISRHSNTLQKMGLIDIITRGNVCALYRVRTDS